MQTQTAQEKELAELIVEALNLEDINAEEIEPEEALFGEGLGLDSIDALEIVYQVEQNFNIPMKEMNEARAAFQSINTLAAFIEARLQG